MKMDDASNIGDRKFIKEVQIPEVLRWHLSSQPFVLTFVFHPEEDIPWSESSVMVTIRWGHSCLGPGSQQILFVECGLAGWGARETGRLGTEVMDGQDWGSVLVWPDKIVCSSHNLSISFLLTIRSNFLVEIPDNTLTLKTARWNVSHACVCCW